ncbi:MAG: hypothetical protein PHU86_01970, partial [Patescibacteria group bacterium]|nr:hypothetical protein [Patescibacteria group bacterium]
MINNFIMPRSSSFRKTGRELPAEGSKSTHEGLIRICVASFFVLISLFILNFVFVNKAYAAAKTWDGGGATNNWSEPENWNPDGVPLVGDTVTIESGYNVNATANVSNSGTITIQNGAVVNITGGTFSSLGAGSQLVNNGIINIEDPAKLLNLNFTNNGRLNVNSNATYTPCQLTYFNNSATGEVIINSTVVRNYGVDNFEALLVSADLNNAGLIRTTVGDIYLDQGGNVTNTGTMETLGSGDIFITRLNHNTSLNNNGGIIRSVGGDGAGQWGYGAIYLGIDITNQNGGKIYNTVIAASSGLTIGGIVLSDAVLTNNNAEVYVTGSAFLSIPVIHNNNGGKIYAAGTINTQFGTVINDNAQIYHTGSNSLWFNGSLTNQNHGVIYSTNSSIGMDSTVINDNSDIYVGPNAEGNIYFSGSLTNDHGGRVYVQDGNNISGITVNGLLVNDNSSQIYISSGPGMMQFGQTVTNNHSSSIKHLGTGTLIVSNGFDNLNGSFLLGGSGQWSFVGNFLNDATSIVTATSGTWELSKNFTNNNSNSIQNIGFYHNNGTINLIGIGVGASSQTLSGNTTFYNLTHNQTKPPAMNEQQTVVYNGYVYSIGGADENWDRVDRVLYAKINSDGSIGQFVPTTSMSQVRTSFGAFAYNGHLYVLGGSNQNSDLFNDVEYGDINEDGTISNWQLANSFTTPRSDFATTVYVYDSENVYVYISGGYSDSGELDDVQYAKINLITGALEAWSTTTSLTRVSEYHQMLASNGYLYFLGGYDGTDVYDTVEYASINIDGTINAWQGTTSFNTARATFGAVINNGYIYVIGGDDWNDALAGVQYALIDTDDGSIGAWSATESLGYKVAQETVNINNGYLYEFGGWDYESDYVSQNSYTTFNLDGTINPWSINHSTPATLYIQANTTQIIEGTFTLEGSSNGKALLRSTSSGTRFNIDPQGTRYVSNVDVKDSSNINATVINPAGSVDSGNNINWWDVHTIISSAGTNGGISPVGEVSVNQGDSQLFTISADPGYRISNVLIDGVSVGAITNYTFTNVISAHTIVAYFTTSATYSISSFAGQGGAISPNGQTIIVSGGNQTYTITPNSYYHIVNVLVDGVSYGALGSYTFSNVQADHSITAFFAIDTYTITVSSGSNGQIVPSSNQEVEFDTSINFVMNPNSGYGVSDVLIDGVSVGAVDNYIFNNVFANHSIEALFTSVYTLTYTAGPNSHIHGTTPQTVNYGVDGTLVTAEPDVVNGYYFLGWSDGVMTLSRTDLNVQSDINVTALFAHGEVYYWSGLGISNNWSEAGNWLVNGSPALDIPGAEDAAIFDSTGLKDVTIDVPVNVNLLYFYQTYTGSSVGYTGTITVNENISISANLLIEDGITLPLGVGADSHDLTVNGYALVDGDIVFGRTINIGGFITNTGTLMATNGSIAITGTTNNSGSIFTTGAYSIQLQNAQNSGGIFTETGNILITGDLDNSASVFTNGGDITVYGYLHNHGFSSFNVGSGTGFGDLRIDGDVVNEGSIFCPGSLAIGGDLTNTNSVFPDGDITIMGNTVNSLSLFTTDGGIVYFHGDVINDGGAIFLSPHFTIDGNLTNTNGSSFYNATVDGIIEVHGSVTNTNGSSLYNSTSGIGKILIDGNLLNENGSSMFNGGASGKIAILGNVTNQTSASLFITSTAGDIYVGGYVVNDRGAMFRNSSTGSIKIIGNFNNTLGSSLIAGTNPSTWIFNGDFINDSTSIVTATPGIWEIYGDFTNENPSNVINVGFYHNNGTIEFAGANAQQINGSTTFYNFKVDNRQKVLGDFSNIASLDIGIEGHTVEIYNGYIYVLGGYGYGSGWDDYLDTVRYAKINEDGTVGDWTTSPNLLNKARAYHSSAVYNGYLYLVGGFDNNNDYSDVEYAKINSDGSIGTWAIATNELSSYRGYQASLAYNGYLYVIGGYDGTSDTNIIEYAALDPDDGSVGTFSLAANTFVGGREELVAFVYNDFLYITGGYGSISPDPTVYYSDTQYSTINFLDGSLGVWTTSSMALPYPVSYSTVAVSGNKIYLVGGERDDTHNKITNVFYTIVGPDHEITAWQDTGSNISTPVVDQWGGVWNGYVYVVGGYTSNSYTGIPDVQYAQIDPPIISDKTLIFEATKTTTIQGEFFAKGDVNHQILIRSSIEGTQSFINPQGTIDVDYLDIKNSYNINGHYINPTNSIDRGNNK